MWAQSSRWQPSVRSSHTVICRADLYPPSGAPILGLPIVGGNVQVDRTASVRRTVDLTLADPTGELIPSDAYAPTAPYGTIIRPYRGIRYPDGTTELMPLGVFRASDVNIRDDGAPGLTISGSDYSRTVSRNAFTDSYVIAAGQNYATAIATLATNRLPGVKQDTDPTAETTPLIVIDANDDPWQHLTDMAASYGAECFYDQQGTFVLQAVRDPTSNQVAVIYSSGEDHAQLTSDTGDAAVLPAAAVLLSTDRSLTDEPGYNGVVYTAESTTLPSPIRTVLFDLDPRSPTYA